MSGWGPRVFPASGGGGGGDQGNPDIVDHVLSIYGEVNLVAGPETTVLSYTTVGSTVTQLVRGEFGGTNIAQYRLYIDNVIQARFVTWFNGPMDGHWDFSGEERGLSLNPGQVIKITAEHGRPFAGDFFARLSIIRIDA